MPLPRARLLIAAVTGVVTCGCGQSGPAEPAAVVAAPTGATDASGAPERAAPPDARPGADLGTQLAAVQADVSAGVTVTAPPPVRLTALAVRTLDDSTLSAAMVQQKLQGVYAGGIHRCYRQAARTAPTLAGAVRLVLVVTGVGRSTAATVSAPSSDLADCLKVGVASWRFAGPRRLDDGEPTEARFEVSLLVAPP